MSAFDAREPDVRQRTDLIHGVSLGRAVWFWLKLGFILLGGPAVEASRHEIRLSAPLVGITAAVVGVILNLAAFSAWHVFWPQGFAGPFEWLPALVCASAFMALFRYKIGVIPVILTYGVAGFLRTCVLPMLD